MLDLTPAEQEMLCGVHGLATQKAMQILTALGKIFGARRMIPVQSVQIAGVSYENLGEAGLAFLHEMVEGGGKTRVKTTLNPAGMDIENWRKMGISEAFAVKQQLVIQAFARMGVIPTCTCTPYLVGNLPNYGDSVAWAESSAVCYANSVIGARTNREGGPSALAAALTGVSPAYGYHLDENRIPGITFRIEAKLSGTHEFGALGKVMGQQMERLQSKPVPFLTGISAPSLEELKSLCASAATYGGAALFHIQGVTPEASQFHPPEKVISISHYDIDQAIRSMESAHEDEVDFVSLGCPHLSLVEIERIAQLLKDRKVTKTFWITTSRPVKLQADQMGYTRVIEEAGAIFASDTCCVVAPIVSRFKALATDSAKACYYAPARNKFKVIIKSFDQVVEEALK